MFDAAAKNVFLSAQQDAERRGGNYLVSGLIIYAAAKTNDDFASLLLDALKTDLDSLTKAVDAEWGARSAWKQDQPITLINEAFEAVAAEAEPGTELHLTSLLTKSNGRRTAPTYWGWGLERVGLDGLAICCGGCNSSRGMKLLNTWFESSYCRDRNINARTVGPVVRRFLRRHPRG